jgi:isopenicillin-N epimerase
MPLYLMMQNLKDQFLLREDITYLNFGSFGACPKPVFEKYQQFQLELEQEPVLFKIPGNCTGSFGQLSALL